MTPGAGLRPLEDLSGRQIKADGRRYLLEESIGRSGSSATYRTSNGDWVIRVFLAHGLDATEHKLTATKRRLVQADATSLVLNYSFVGPARLLGRHRISRGLRVWAVVRKYGPRTLQDVIFGDAPVMPQLTYRIALELAQSIHALHDAGISHGDLRPSNVLLSDDSAVQVADFGLVSDDPKQDFDQSEQLFLSPEALWRGVRNNPASDWYSYGKVVRALYERALPTSEKEREIIWRLTDECLRLDPRERPDSRLVLATLGVTPNVETDLESLRPAIYADVATRLGFATMKAAGQSLHEAVRTATELAAVELQHVPLFRYSSMNLYERVHFLGSLTLKQPLVRAIEKDAQRPYAVVKVVNFSEKNSIESHLPTVDPPDGWVDPEWAAELESRLRLELSDLELTHAEVQSAVVEQIDSARKITSAVLRSDDFVRSEDVAAMMSGQCPGITDEEVRTLRDMGYLVSFPVGDVNLYPLFQFDDHGMPMDVVKEVSDIVGYEGSSWSRGLRWLMRTPLLRENSPAEWIKSGNSPAAVVDSFAARRAA